MARWDSVGQGDLQFAREPVEWKEVFALSNDSGILLARTVRSQVQDLTHNVAASPLVLERAPSSAVY
jgi:hypothetical protein